MMDETLADESGIPKLSASDDIPVHSTPIKGGKIPLPSTKSIMRGLISKHANRDDYEESLQVIKPFEDRSLVPSYVRHNNDKDLQSDKRPYEDKMYEKERFVSGQFKEYQYSTKDLSNIDNLRPRVNERPTDKAFNHERAATPGTLNEKYVAERSDFQPQDSSVKFKMYQSGEVKQKNYARNVDTQSLGTAVQGINSKIASRSGSQDKMSKTVTNKAVESQRQTQSAGKEMMSSVTGKVGHDTVKFTAFSRVINDSLDLSQPASPRDLANSDFTSSVGKVDTASDPLSKSGTRPIDNWKYTDKELEDVHSYSKKRPTIHSPKLDRKNNKSLSRQNTSFTELENTTLQKQRQEIQLLVAELRDRDRELSEMASAHQQQLVAWEQDRQRLGAMDRKCTQYEEDLRSKTVQLRNYVANLKSLRTREVETLQEIESLKASREQLTKENDTLTADNAKFKETTISIQKSLDELHTTVGKLRAREEELVTTVRLKEKDISSATSQMRELSERLQQLDLRAKECQDHERAALKERDDWKQRYSNLQEEIHSVQRELDKTRREASHLADENKSARQQLSLVQKEAAMMEKCKDELIESIRVKQERTDAQLKNFRELYEHQLKVIAGLQIQLDTSKEARHRLSMDEPQLNSSNQGRSSQVCETSLEHSTGSQPTTLHNKYREPDTQSSGYQSQLSEHPPHQSNQQPLGYHGDNISSNYSRQQKQHGDLHRNLSTRNHTRNFSSDTESSHSRRLSDIDNNSQTQGERLYSHIDASSRPKPNGPGSDWSSRAVNTDTNLKSSYQETRSSTATTLAYQEPRLSTVTTLATYQDQRLNSHQQQTCMKLPESERACGSVGANDQSHKNFSPESVILRSNVKFHFSEKQHESSESVMPNMPYLQRESRDKTVHNNNAKCSNEQVQSSSRRETESCQFLHTENNPKNTETDLSQHNSDGGYKRNDHAIMMRFSERPHQVEEKVENNHLQHQRENNVFHENNGAKYKDDTYKVGDSSQGISDEIDSAQSQQIKVDGKSHLDKKFESCYMFENKLCSFLEDFDDIDDSIWNDPPPQNVNLTNLSLVDTCSPASKLRKLLIESEQMIQSLERSADSPIRKEINKSANQHQKGT
ncbi:apical junction molecule-like [Dreissena polymorpha]|uniref:Coiled-coil domain-containing protein 62 n=1 Tax=Dreissena polymorpha TaxID=45954 RepID=A0A9D4RZ90_DREPO|nr:apical junction molecule-like [Dreissena polymorpha]KAH3884458.1 hypothetical protein DPMN_008438 [Dreissena polymorpha]